MDWAAHDHRPGARTVAAPALVHTYWRVVGPTEKPIVCALYRTAAGFWEVRTGYNVDDVMRSQVVRSRDAADDVAAVWKIAALEKGFRELTGSA